MMSACSSKGFLRSFNGCAQFLREYTRSPTGALTERWHERLDSVQIPTLVIHGTEDPILPFDHGEAIADSIPGAKLLALSGVGHELPDQEVDKVVGAILDFTS